MNLFGDGSPKKRKASNEAHKLAPYFDAIARLVGPVAVAASRGRVARIAAAMLAAGVVPADLDRLPAVIRANAPYMKSLDLSALQTCWPWLVEPPTRLKATPADWRSLSLDEAGQPPV